MDRLIACVLCILPLYIFTSFSIVNEVSFYFEYAIQLMLLVIFFIFYKAFSSVVRFGLIILIVHKLYECLEEISAFREAFVENSEVAFILGDSLALIGLGLIAFGTQAKLKHQTKLMSRDSLTKTYNKSAIERLTKSELSAGGLKKSSTTIIIADIDRFKTINDSFGHQVGDEILIDVANHIASEIRRSDLLARWGGDEFVITCPNTSKAEAINIMKRIQKGAAEKLQIGSTPITLSIGAATSNSSSHSFKSLFQEADEALYQVKGRGRNGLTHYNRSLES